MTETNGIDPTEREKLITQAYTRATSDLREAHKDEFNTLRIRRSAELGIEWTPRKSKEDAALDQITELLAQFPELGDKLAQRLIGLD